MKEENKSNQIKAKDANNYISTQEKINKEVLSELKLVIKEGTRNKDTLTEYDPFNMNSVLCITCSNSTIFILLKNGTLFSLGDKSYTLGRKFIDASVFKDKLGAISIKKKIMDISCGRDHCMLRTEDFKIYTWGNNYYGQLGIPNFTTTSESNKEEPFELVFFNTFKVIQIKCCAFNSFAITDTKILYGWGSNEYGQLYQESDNIKFTVPTIISIIEQSQLDFFVSLDRKGENNYYYEGMIIILVYLDKSNEDLKLKSAEDSNNLEKVLRKELSDLVVKLNEIVQNSGGGITIKEGEHIEEVRMRNIEYLIDYYQQTIHRLETEISANISKNLDIQIETLNSQFEYNISQKSVLKEKFKYLNQTINYDSIQNISETKDDKKAKKFVRNINIEEVLTKANAELQIQKCDLLNENIKHTNETKEKEFEKKKKQEYLMVFNKIKENYQEVIKKREDQERIIEAEYAMTKLNQEIKIFDINLLKNIDQINKENDSLLSNLNTALNNLKKLDDKIASMNFDRRNETSQKLLLCYRNNSNLAKQNNILTQEIINYSNILYEKTFDQVVKSKETSSNFTVLKKTIDDFKKNYQSTNHIKSSLSKEPTNDEDYDSDDYI